MARLRFRYSLRTFLLLVVVASLPLGWLAKTMNRVRRQRAAVAEIVDEGGEIRYDYNSRRRASSPFGPWLIRRLFGDEVFAKVTYVGWHGGSKPPTDNDVRLLTSLPDLEWVILYGSKVTDASLPHLARLPRLKTLSLDATALSRHGLAGLSSCRTLTSLELSHVTDEKLAGLASLTQLQSLAITHSPVTEDGLSCLKKLTNLEALDLWRVPSLIGDGLKYVPHPDKMRRLCVFHAPLTNESLKNVADMRKLRHLTLIATHITDAGLETLGGLSGLSEVLIANANVGDIGITSLIHPGLLSLCIANTNVTDDIVGHIVKARRLEWLDIRFTKITDASIQELSKCTSLVRLELGPSISIEAAKKLKASLPDCHIELYDANDSSQFVELP